ncbi:amidohydrolase family protein [Amycolatopsis acidicola]|uniref:Amidohydrolase family protein n=1 Tax=Amycolatopsis acidicola TaxID=2596893 RepID=A0A5N0VG39_9PSEU|nr:amidohydrolase family protein [Amycolatopsis acidicola]KAA9164404.1 amidohydrolase family protein [Amycolatopsis acidicola]
MSDALFDHPSQRDDWLDLTTETALDPDQPIVDAHHHLWARENFGYLLDAFTDDVVASGHNVVASVYAECTSGWEESGRPDNLRAVGEARFVAAERQSTRRGPLADPLAGYVAYLDALDESTVRQAIEAHRAVPGARLLGFRQSATWDPDPAVKVIARTPPAGLLASDEFARGFRHIAEAGLTFDAWVFHTQLGDVEQLAQRFPGTTIVLDHAGGPIGLGGYRDAEVFPAWATALRRLAARPNVHLKFGGLAMPLRGEHWHEDERPPGSDVLAEHWAPWFTEAIEAFGTARTMFESNFPVDRISGHYGTLWNAFKRLAAALSEDEKDQIFRTTAVHTYGLRLTSR